MKREYHEEEIRELIDKGLYHGTGVRDPTESIPGNEAKPASTAQDMKDDEGEPTENDSKTKRASPEQNKATRKLIRLWSAANHALVKGCSLQALPLLTRIEVIRTNRHLRIFTKRMVWSAREALRRSESKAESQPLESSSVAFGQ
eukprot:4898463-Karenia_brevis.AAC.1